MKRLLAGLTFAAAALHAQAPERVAVKPPVVISVAPTHIEQQMLANLEKNFDLRLRALDEKDPLDLLGGTRGLYLEDYGIVFTTELSLVVAPGLFPMKADVSPETKALVHQRKLARLPKLEELMKDLMKVSALTLTTVPGDQKIVFAVQLRYLPYESTSGLPAWITMSADKKAVLQGDIKTKVE